MSRLRFTLALLLALTFTHAPALAQLTAPASVDSIRTETARTEKTLRIDTPQTERVIPAITRPAPASATKTDTLHGTAAMLTPAGTDWTRIGITAGGLTSAITALHIYQLNAWWANQRGKFHVIEDAEYQANFDKAGHLFGACYSSYFFDEAYRWAGVDTAQSALLGALCGAVWEFYVEIEDGFAGDWGFSRGDAKSDITGAMFYLMNRRIPFLRNFEYKWSYWPSSKLLNNNPDIPGQTMNIIEDYTGQSYWLSMDLHSALKDLGIENPWPKWLRVALGASGAGLGPLDLHSPTGDEFDLRHIQWMISLDYDLGELIPHTDIGFLDFLRRALNYWHMPAPAWEFSPEHHFYVLFPFSLKIGK